MIKIRRQPNVISSGGDRWKAWEVDMLGMSFYVQQTDQGLDHVLELGEDRHGYYFVQRERAEEVVTILAALDKDAGKLTAKK